MKFLLEGHDRRYPIEQLLLNLFPEEKAEMGAFQGDGVVSRLSDGRQWRTATASVTREGVTRRGSARCLLSEATEQLTRQILQRSLYRAALPFLPKKPSWGALSGVRPTKLTTRVLVAGGSRGEADRLLRQVYDVSPERRELCLDASEASLMAWKKQQPGDVSLYVGIPFCPTRCVYCSFVSTSVARSGNLVEPYLAALEQEIQAASVGIGDHRIRSFYMGGGTPTTLTTAQLRRLLDCIAARFDLSQCLEFTVEAGRPDTLDPEKLRMLRDMGVTRISINPQTMDDRVLEILGRSHTRGDILNCWEQAVAAGHEDINMDLIAGLPGDTEEGFQRTLEEVLSMGPTSITVHTLALKKSAALFYEKRTALPTADAVENMLTQGNRCLRQTGYIPYYLYRQKYMTGSFENVGWCRPGRENLYNIYMMEEMHSILSLGAGGVTKRVEPGRITRLSNPKYPTEYIREIQRICSGKREVIL